VDQALGSGRRCDESLQIMFGWLMNYFDRRRRSIDLDVLWRAITEDARDFDQAKAAFLFHLMNDPAWTRYYTDEELARFVKELKPLA
jgi:hypothetical protein